MRTTIKTASGEAVVRYEEESSSVLLTVKQKTFDGEEIVHLRMQPDQVGVLIFALEQASIQQAMGVAA